METVEAQEVAVQEVSVQQEQILEPEATTDGCPSRYRFTVADYRLMIEAGIFDSGASVELINGEILEMAPMKYRHAQRVAQLNETLVKRFAGQALVWPQCPVEIPPSSAPEPDFALVKLPPETYDTRLPRVEDVLLMIEIADATLETDRAVKAVLYAGAGIPDYWIVNLREGTLEVYRDPQNGHYRSLQTLSAGTPVAPLAFPDVPVAWG